MASQSYQFAKPVDLRAAADAGRPVYLPVGCLEYHGPHLPVGVDMFTADALCHRAAALTGGFVLPPLWLSAGVLPLPFGVTLSLATLRNVVAEILHQLATHGFRVIVVVSGHGALDHLHVLREETDRLMVDSPNVRAFTTMWNELNADLEGDIHDHGAKVETSYMMEFHPDTVELEALSPDRDAEHDGVYAANPRFTASRDWGRTMADHAVARLVDRVEAMRAGEPANSWDLLQVLVARLQAGDLDITGGGREPGGGLWLELHNPHSQSKYITAIPEATIDGTPLDLVGASLANPSVGEGHTDRAVSELGPLAGFYLRRDQRARLRIPNGRVPEGRAETVLRLRLADVLDVGATGTIDVPEKTGGDQ